MDNNIKTDCKCIYAVKNTYFNLINQNYKPSLAFDSAIRVLKYYHPEIPNHEIGKRATIIINPSLNSVLLNKKPLNNMII